MFDKSGHLIVHHFVNVMSYFNFPFVFSSFVTGSSLKRKKRRLLDRISRRFRWLCDLAVNWSSTSHLSQEEDRLCSRSVNRILVKIFRRRSCKVREGSGRNSLYCFTSRMILWSQILSTNFYFKLRKESISLFAKMQL